VIYLATALKRRSTQSILISILFASISACGGGGGSSDSTENDESNNPEQPEQQPVDNPSNNPADNTWTVDDFVFVGNTSAQSATNENIAIAISTTGFDTSNGLFSGSALGLSLTNSPEGVYAVTDFDGLVAASGNGAAAISIQVTIGTLNTNPVQATQWVSLATSGTATVLIDDDGFRTVTIDEPITLERGIDLGDGLPGGDLVQFTMQNIRATVQQ